MRTVRARQQRYADAVAIIEREYARPLDLDAVAEACVCSRREVQRAFTAQGTTFRDALVAIRMRAAAELLLNQRHVPITEVSARVAYLNVSQFARAFRRVYGCAPREYRANAGPRDSGVLAA
ncbi:AraC family transcriptional regulator [Conexibacter sp. JD483]|uniref:helix-turn-helix transcriptional regulator n=1 Tax=Conexibacter sp. JD483 TaxID=3064471 RepID=UPI0028703070|nr:AraC family transcriptional regulator [Conexibacter sp. JD483]